MTAVGLMTATIRMAPPHWEQTGGSTSTIGTAVPTSPASACRRTPRGRVAYQP